MKKQVNEARNRSFHQEGRSSNGRVDLWLTKEGRAVFVLPMWEQVRHTVAGESDHRIAVKMLWYDDIDHDWVLSDLRDHLDRKIGEIDLLNILDRHRAGR